MQGGNTCKRLRQNIKGFKQYNVFRFESFGPIYYISWEKDDFKYYDTLSKMTILSASMTSIDAPINNLDAYYVNMFSYPNHYWTTTAEVIINNMLPYHLCWQYDQLFRFYVNIGFGFHTGINNLTDERGEIQIKVNTNNQSIQVSGLYENIPANYSLYSTTGKLIKEGEIMNSIFHYNNLPNGLYLLSINNNQRHTTKKLIIF
jgi:hypothetical protein